MGISKLGPKVRPCFCEKSLSPKHSLLGQLKRSTETETSTSRSQPLGPRHMMTCLQVFVASKPNLMKTSCGPLNLYFWDVILSQRFPGCICDILSSGTKKRFSCISLPQFRTSHWDKKLTMTGGTNQTKLKSQQQVAWRLQNQIIRLKRHKSTALKGPLWTCTRCGGYLSSPSLAETLMGPSDVHLCPN